MVFRFFDPQHPGQIRLVRQYGPILIFCFVIFGIVCFFLGKQLRVGAVDAFGLLSDSSFDLHELKTAVTAAGTAALMPEKAVLAGDGHVLADWCYHVCCLLCG